jgi:hypothetical protein
MSVLGYVVRGAPRCSVTLKYFGSCNPYHRHAPGLHIEGRWDYLTYSCWTVVACSTRFLPLRLA